MTNESTDTQVFSGLILLTGQDKPGLADALFEALSPFAVSIIDIDQIVISSRLILTVQISLNQVHQAAIESDLEILAQRLDIDIASVFDLADAPSAMPHDATIRISASKMLPRFMKSVTAVVLSSGGNILRINRSSISPMVIEIDVACSNAAKLQEALGAIPIESDLKISVH
jgi:phosphoserine phosphatase